MWKNAEPNDIWECKGAGTVSQGPFDRLEFGVHSAIARYGNCPK